MRSSRRRRTNSGDRPRSLTASAGISAAAALQILLTFCCDTTQHVSVSAFSSPPSARQLLAGPLKTTSFATGAPFNPPSTFQKPSSVIFADIASTTTTAASHIRPNFSATRKNSIASGRTSLALSAKKQNSDDNDNDNDDNDDKDDDEKEAKDGPLTKLTAPIRTFFAALIAVLPDPLVALFTTLYTKFVSIFPTLRVAFASFLVGGILGIGLILYPIYESFENTPEPVMLFETILSDLDRSYVDRVDTNKLFETGISAMLRSLDPYTEFEGRTEAEELTESVAGQYGGVGLVISGSVPSDKAKLKQQEALLRQKQNEQANEAGGAGEGSKLLPQDAIDDNERLINNNNNGEGSNTDDVALSNPEDMIVDSPDDDEETLAAKAMERRAILRARRQGVRVVNAFEGYAYDYGMRVGDKLTAIDGERLTPDAMSVEEVRNKLRGEPGTFVEISFLREGVEGEKTVSIPRTVVQVNDVKLATLVGNAEDGIGYISLSGFNANAGREVRNAILGLQRLTEDATGGKKSLQGLVLDLRGNPGGLLNSAVDVASLLVPAGSDIVSAQGRGFPGILYRSTAEPILSPKTKLAVLVNSQTASAAEIVSGAVQDLDVGVIVGHDRTFGKGLVQNVETLPYNTALKYTVAKYYTPSGRCIQSTNYKEGGGLNPEDGKYQASKVADRDQKTYFTKHGREVKDGGGVVVDYKVDALKSSALEYTLLRSGAYADFAAKWSRENQLTNNLDVVNESTYQKFKSFVMEQQKAGEIKLEAVYTGPIENLKKALKQSGYKGTTRELEQLQANLVKEIERDFEKYKNDIKEDIGQNILARYLPESMLLEIGVKRDKQVEAAVKLVRDDTKTFNTLLGRVNGKVNNDKSGTAVVGGVGTAIASNEDFIQEDNFRIVFLGDKGIPTHRRN